jgi:hypothetical protein
MTPKKIKVRLTRDEIMHLFNSSCGVRGNIDFYAEEVTEECKHEEDVHWNPDAKVVQCFGCGVVFSPEPHPTLPDRFWKLPIHKCKEPTTPQRTELPGKIFYMTDATQSIAYGRINQLIDFVSELAAEVRGVNK